MSPSLRAAVAAAAARLTAAGVPSPQFDAEELAAHSLGVERRDLWSVPSLGAAASQFEEYVARRAAREPLQHITGVAWFRHLGLAVGPGVFVPRPETELVAGVAVEAAAAVVASGRQPVVVDLCTGSGAIALSVATEVPAAEVHAVEADPAAAEWAARNVAALAPSVDLVVGDMADALPALDGVVDVVVANPPYIPVDGLIRDPEVAAHDPAAALWSGADGLDAMRVLERAAARLLRPGGLVVAEHADLQGESAPGVFRTAARWDDVRDHRALAGRDRYLTARKP